MGTSTGTTTGTGALPEDQKPKPTVPTPSPTPSAPVKTIQQGNTEPQMFLTTEKTIGNQVELVSSYNPDYLAFINQKNAALRAAPPPPQYINVQEKASKQNPVNVTRRIPNPAYAQYMQNPDRFLGITELPAPPPPKPKLDAIGVPIKPGQPYVVSINAINPPNRLKGLGGGAAGNVVEYVYKYSDEGITKSQTPPAEMRRITEEQSFYNSLTNVQKLTYKSGTDLSNAVFIPLSGVNDKLRAEAEAKDLGFNLIRVTSPTGSTPVNDSRDLFLTNMIDALYQAKGNPRQTQYVVDALQKSGYQVSGGVIKDALSEGIWREEYYNSLKPSGGVGEGSYGGVNPGAITGPKTPNPANFQGSISGVTTSASAKLGSSLGQEATGYITRNEQGQVVLQYSPEQAQTIKDAIITNKEYGGNPTFLSGNINTENVAGPVSPVLSGQVSAGGPKKPIDQLSQPTSLGEQTTAQKADLSSLSGVKTVNVGGHNILESLTFTPSPEAVAIANAAREAEANSINLGIGLQQLSQEQKLGGTINALISEAQQAGSKTVDVLSVATFKDNGITTKTYNVLEQIPITQAKSRLEDIVKENRTDVVFGYTPAPRAEPSAGATLEFEMPSKLELLAGRPATAIADLLSDTGIGTAVAIAGFPGQLKASIEKGVKGDLPGLFGREPLSPELQAFSEKYINVNPVSSGVEGLLTGKGISEFKTTKGAEYDIPYLVGSAGLLLAGAKDVIPLRVTKVTLEEGAGLTHPIEIGTGLTFGYAEGGSKYIIAFKPKEGPLQFGKPEPSTYYPEPLPIKLTGRGFTESEGGGLHNELFTGNKALDYLVKENILTPYDVSVIQAAKKAAPVIVKAPVEQFHETFGNQPLETVLSGPETETLKNIIKTGQEEKGLGPQYGSLADIPFTPGKVKVGDVDIAVENASHQKTIGEFAASELNKVAEKGRTFTFEQGAVFLQEAGSSTKIIDLPIKGVNEEGGPLASNTYGKVFGVKEPKKTFDIEGIETKTPHYNTIRRLTTITRIGSKEMKSALPGMGLTTKYGNYIGPEIGRMKDVARAYRGFILGAKAFRARGRPGDIRKAEVLERSAETFKARFQHRYSFTQALKEIEGELIVYKKEGQISKESSVYSISKQVSKTSPIIEPSMTGKPQKEKPSEPSLVKEEKSIIPKESSLKSLEPTSVSKAETIISSRGIKSAVRQSSVKTAFRSSSKPIKVKSTSRSITTSKESSHITSSIIKSPSVKPSLFSKTSSIISKSPASQNLISPSTSIISESNLSTQRPLTLTTLTTPDIIPTNENTRRELLLPDIANKTDQGKKHKGKRFNFLGNVSEVQVEKSYNRIETIYGNKKIGELVRKDIAPLHKRHGSFVQSKSNGSFVNKKTYSTLKKETGKQKKVKL